MPATSYWLDEAWPGLPAAPRAGRPEVAVIGGGVTGCSCALALAERGVRVRLYEAGELAAGASGRNGGFALRGATAPYDRVKDALGPGPARLVMELTVRALDRMEALAGDALRRVGSLRLAADAAERDALRREHDALLADGFPVEWVADLPAPLDRLYTGAIHHPGDGALQPARWIRHLAAHAVAAGAELREREPVRVEELQADAVVVAGDGYTAAVLPELARLIRPTRGQVLATEPLAETLYPRPHYARGGFDYWQQLEDSRLVLGGCRDAAFAAEDTDELETTSTVQDRLDELVERLVGRRPAVTHRWAGIWGTTPDLLPLVGRVPGRENVWVAAGYSGHGNVLGFACGELVARALLGDRQEELRLFDPERASLRPGSAAAPARQP